MDQMVYLFPQPRCDVTWTDQDISVSTVIYLHLKSKRYTIHMQNPQRPLTSVHMPAVNASAKPHRANDVDISGKVSCLPFRLPDIDDANVKIRTTIL